MSEPIISVSGLRGIVGESLTPLVAARYVAAFAGDARSPGRWLSAATGARAGRCWRRSSAARWRPAAGECSMPTWPRRRRWACWCGRIMAAGGVQISASHNPPAYNGLKLFDHDGRVLPAAAGQAGARSLSQASHRHLGARVDQVGVAAADWRHDRRSTCG